MKNKLLRYICYLLIKIDNKFWVWVEKREVNLIIKHLERARKLGFKGTGHNIIASGLRFNNSYIKYDEDNFLSKKWGEIVSKIKQIERDLNIGEKENT